MMEKLNIEEFKNDWFCVNEHEILESNLNLKEIIEELKKQGYEYFVKANDNFLSGWGFGKEKHVQISFCKNATEYYNGMQKMKQAGGLTYINWNFLTYENIRNVIRNKSYTLRNDFK